MLLNYHFHLYNKFFLLCSFFFLILYQYFLYNYHNIYSLLILFLFYLLLIQPNLFLSLFFVSVILITRLLRHVLFHVFVLSHIYLFQRCKRQYLLSNTKHAIYALPLLAFETFPLFGAYSFIIEITISSFFNGI